MSSCKNSSYCTTLFVVVATAIMALVLTMCTPSPEPSSTEPTTEYRILERNSGYFHIERRYKGEEWHPLPSSYFDADSARASLRDIKKYAARDAQETVVRVINP